MPCGILDHLEQTLRVTGMGVSLSVSLRLDYGDQRTIRETCQAWPYRHLACPACCTIGVWDPRIWHR